MALLLKIKKKKAIIASLTAKRKNEEQMRIIYMGTPEFAAAPLYALAEAGEEIVGVLTQPDRRSGRGQKLTSCPLKLHAQKLGLPIYQPERVSSEESVAYLRSLNADIIIVCAYGQLLSREILELTPFGAINIHASLLPEYRGAAPIARAIMDGAEKTGITIMYMATGLDSGDIMLSEATDIADKTFGELEAELSTIGAKLIVSACALLKRGAAPRMPQGDNFTYAAKLQRSDARISFDKDCTMVYNLIRSCDPLPGAYAMLNDGRTVKLYGALKREGAFSASPGEVVELSGDAIFVACQSGAVGFRMLKPEGKKLMDARSFYLGIRDKENLRFL